MEKTEAMNPDTGTLGCCGAKTYNGLACQTLPMANGRCRLHGGLSTGPRTVKGLEKSRKARLVHGYYSAEAKAQRRENAQWMLELRQGLKHLDTL